MQKAEILRTQRGFLGALSKCWSYCRSVLCGVCIYQKIRSRALCVLIVSKETVKLYWPCKKKMSSHISNGAWKVGHWNTANDEKLVSNCVHATKHMSNCVHHVKELRLSLAWAIGATQASQGDCLWTNSKVHILILWNKGHMQVIFGYQRQALINM